MFDPPVATVGRRAQPGFLGEILGLVSKALAQTSLQPAGLGAIEVVEAGVGRLVSHTSSSIRHGLASR